MCHATEVRKNVDLKPRMLAYSGAMNAAPLHRVRLTGDRVRHLIEALQQMDPDLRVGVVELQRKANSTFRGGDLFTCELLYGKGDA